MVKSPKIAKKSKSPCFFSWIRKSYPSITKITQYLLFLFYAIFFQKKINKIWLSSYRFLFLRKKKHKKRKNEKWLPFYLFSFYLQTNTKNGKTKIDFPFIVSWFFKEQTQKTGKRKPTSILTCFVLLTTKHQKR